MLRNFWVALLSLVTVMSKCWAQPANEIISPSTGMKLVFIPKGEFRMGSTDADVQRMVRNLLGFQPKFADDEKPSHAVRISRDFYLGQTEVTQGQWKSVMGTEPWKGTDHVKDGPNYATTCVSWDDAMSFVRKLNEQEGTTKYRLPTEAEWEYACRGGKETLYSFGNEVGQLNDYGWFGGIFGDGNAKNERYAHEVGKKKANPFGLFDMHGNVYEWCADWYDEKYYGKSSETSVDPENKSEATYRVLRGGSWNGDENFCRSAARGEDWPNQRLNFIGFRILRTQ